MIRSNLVEFIDILKNKPALICGSGPSLHTVDFNRISSNTIIFACNQSITRMKYCDYFCFTDFAIIEKTDLFEYGCEISTKIICFSDITSYIDNIPYYTKYKDKIFYVKRNKNNHFNFGGDDGLIFGSDVIHVTTHFAYLTGCNPIYLIGVDLTHVNGKKYCDSVFFTGDLNWNVDAASIEVLNSSYDSWVEIKKQNETLKVYNLSPYSKLIDLYETEKMDKIYK